MNDDNSRCSGCGAAIPGRTAWEIADNFKAHKCWADKLRPHTERQLKEEIKIKIKTKRRPK